MRFDFELESLAALEPHRQAADDARHAHVTAFVSKGELIGQPLLRTQPGVGETQQECRQARDGDRGSARPAQKQTTCGHRDRDSGRSGQKYSGGQLRLCLQRADAEHKGNERRQWHG